MTDEERAKKCLIRGQQRFHCNYREHPEKLLGDVQVEEIAAEFAAVREETQADWRREKQVLVNRCTALEEQVTAVRREERERCALECDVMTATLKKAGCPEAHWNISATLSAAIREQSDDSSCVHEWVNPTNEAVQAAGHVVCINCGAIREQSDD